MINVYDELANDLANQMDLVPSFARQIVSTLSELGVLDYDTLKELYLDPDSEDTE